MADRDVTQVGVLVATRRGELGLTQQELANAANVAVGTVVALESGRRWPQAATRSAIERALHWASGDLTRLRRGGVAMSLPQRVDLGHGVTVEVGDEEVTDPEALRRTLAQALSEDITWEDAFDKLDAIADLHSELRAILRKLRPANGA